MSTMKINLAVCGKFHYHNYIRYVSERGLLNRFYYSHRRATNHKFLGLERQQAINVWLKEYLLGIHNRVLRGRYELQMAPFYARLWEAGVLARWRRADIFHFMLHGNARNLVRRAKQEGSIIIAEAVNQHIEDMHAIVDEEREVLGLKRSSELSRAHLDQLEELAASNFLAVPSAIVRDSFVKRGYDAGKIFVLPFGVDTQRFRPFDNNESSQTDRVFRVLCVGQLSPRKGQRYLLEAWKALDLPNAELLLIGAISHEMTAMLATYRGVFRHIPNVPNDRLRDYYARSAVFILLSLEDGCSYVCGEAMACGVPVITTVTNGASEVIEHGKNGFVIPSRSTDAIAKYLELLYQNPELRAEMSLAAVTKAKKDLSWKHYARQMCDFYESLSEYGIGRVTAQKR
jgi:glycosyltransferase involved in cell wall biosynthesis